jgi:hypothetical protein
MDQYWRARRSLFLWGFMLLALAFSAMLYSYGPLITGEARYDGAIGVVLGLYVCSHPASNVLDLLFMEGGAGRRAPSAESGVAWYLLNLLVLLAGWLAVLVGVIQFTT